MPRCTPVAAGGAYCFKKLTMGFLGGEKWDDSTNLKSSGEKNRDRTSWRVGMRNSHSLQDLWIIVIPDDDSSPRICCYTAVSWASYGETTRSVGDAQYPTQRRCRNRYQSM